MESVGLTGECDRLNEVNMNEREIDTLLAPETCLSSAEANVNVSVPDGDKITEFIALSDVHQCSCEVDGILSAVSVIKRTSVSCDDDAEVPNGHSFVSFSSSCETDLSDYSAATNLPPAPLDVSDNIGAAASVPKSSHAKTNDDVSMRQLSSSSQETVGHLCCHKSSSSMSQVQYNAKTTISTAELRPEEVRWLYRDCAGRQKKWFPFIGYDSLRIECKFRETRARFIGNSFNQADAADELVVVRGGLYEVDVVQKTCAPIFWTEEGDKYDVIRGYWFVDPGWQPLDVDEYADAIEKEHIALFEDELFSRDNESIPKCQTKAATVSFIDLKDCRVEWLGLDSIYLYQQKSPSKFYRTISRSFRFTKSSGAVRLQRGYQHEAVMTDKPPDITHLVFVIHGIGQRMYAGSVLKCCADIREACQKMFKHIPDNFHDKRAEFLPVEWRSKLTLDGDTVASVTPNKVRDIRMFLNDSAMDVMYYTSPLYRTEITSSLQMELNRLYASFTARNPYFEANGGKVSIVAHSLGAVIVYDIITRWDPASLETAATSCGVVPNDCSHPSSSLDENNSHHVDKIRNELESARQRVLELEQQLKAAEHCDAVMPLNFKLECLFTLGSPLAVFLALRGVQPDADTDSSTQHHILPTNLCQKLLNVFHPSDPIAYRLEPLIVKQYAMIKPLQIHRHNSSSPKEPYESMSELFYSPEKSSSTLQTSVNDSITNEYVDDELTTSSDSLAGCNSRDSNASSQAADRPTLDCRLDYMLRVRAMESAYIATLTSHTSYWTNLDVALFILTQIFSASSQDPVDD